MSELMMFVLVIGIPIIFFLVFRALVLWYWRIDRIVVLLESIDDRLSAICEEEKPRIVYPEKEKDAAE